MVIYVCKNGCSFNTQKSVCPVCDSSLVKNTEGEKFLAQEYREPKKLINLSKIMNQVWAKSHAKVSDLINELEKAA